MDAQFGFPEEDSTSEDGVELLGAAAMGRQSLLMRIVVRVSRARWFAFLRRVFLYQNGVRRELGSNPLNSGVWIGLEAVILVTQIVAISVTLAMSKEEKPVWPLRAWALGYDLGSVLGFPLLFWRYKHQNMNGENGRNELDVEQQRITEESRTSNIMSRIQTTVELFFAIWFVVGNLWVFDGTHNSFRRSPKLMRLCIGLLAWNALTYSFPFILFVFLCFCVPLIHRTLGYNMNMVHRGASEEQISRLPVWKFSEVSVSSNDSDEDCAEKLSTCEHPKDTESECCICLAEYKDKDEVRELPCSHIFHLRCIDKWLTIISSCPLCKQHLQG
ncbi:E3 ubiquitin-protein ligase At4g11680-like [Nymphaea colorata]|nr:E3 ubiquitin-protein ligase At4g11680-like [Nymphaea colorata]